MLLASSCSIRWNSRSEPLRSTRTAMPEYLASKARATFSATGKSTDVYQTTFPSFCAAATNAGLAGTASANVTRGASATVASAADCWRKPLRDGGLRIFKSLGAGHDHGLARRLIEIEISGYAVHDGRSPRNDRHVVGTGKARNDAFGGGAESRTHEARHVRHDAALKRAVE